MSFVLWGVCAQKHKIYVLGVKVLECMPFILWGVCAPKIKRYMFYRGQSFEIHGVLWGVCAPKIIRYMFEGQFFWYLQRIFPASPMLLLMPGTSRCWHWQSWSRWPAFTALYPLGPRSIISQWVSCTNMALPGSHGVISIKIKVGVYPNYDVHWCPSHMWTNPNVSNGVQLYLFGYPHFFCKWCQLVLLRLTTASEFVRINGGSPLTGIAGFTPWRISYRKYLTTFV